ncbi:MAG TPA: WG repeat-containing protein [Bacteroidia bacterium]|jgi:hypothetical protein|nr:WG repeat-containing protein [Bacteroidia bacterium]
MKKQIIALASFLFISCVSLAQEKLIPVHRDVKYGYAYSEDGPLILPARYDDALYFEDGLAPVKTGDKWGYINEQGVLVIPIKFDYANIFTDGYATVGKAGGTDYLYGLINRAGVLVIPMKYNGIGEVSEGLISVIVGNKLGFINIKGVQVIPLKFDVGPSGQLADFAGGYAKLQMGKKFEFINKAGKEITPAKYTGASDFKEGMATVAIDTNWNKHTSDGSKETMAWGFIDGTGKEVIPCKYENVGAFDNGFGTAWLDGYQFKIDKTGKVVDTLTKPAKRYVAPLDSNTFSGKINKMGRLTVLYSKGFIKYATLNNMPVYNISTSPINIDVRKMGLKPGSNATFKIVFTKGATVKFLTGQGIE